LRQKIDNREQGQMLFPHNAIQDAYNSAVITGNYALSERYAACWLWLLMAEKEQRAERRGKISPHIHIKLLLKKATAMQPQQWRASAAGVTESSLGQSAGGFAEAF
jgi:hypothetical protein